MHRALGTRARLLAAVLTAATVSARAAEAQTPAAKESFTAEFHGIAQYDAASYMQTARAAGLPIGAHLSSGGVWRRLRASVTGTAFTDWTYLFELQGNTTGVGSPVSVRQAYVEYDGWGPLTLRAGAYSVSVGMEGSSSAATAMLLERASVSSLQRAVGGGPATALALLYSNRDFFASLAFSTTPLADTPFDLSKHQAVAARAAKLVYRDSDLVVAGAASATAVLRAPQSSPASGAVRKFQLNGDGELGVDTTKLVSSGPMDIEHVWSWGLESAGAWHNLFAEAGYFLFGADLRHTLTDMGRGYHGYYLGGAWVLTGEQRRWSASSGAFSGPAPSRSLDEGGFGAFELTARYSDVDLNDHPGQLNMPVPAGGNRGGDQRILAMGLNWFPTSQFRLTLQGQSVQISRLGAWGANPNADIGQNYQSIALRSQFTF